MEVTKEQGSNSLGEFGLIELLTKNIEIQQASTILGVGDAARR